MPNKPKAQSVTVTTAGTRVRLLTNPNVAKEYRFVPSIYFEALHTNTGHIYIGGADVSSTLYTTMLEAKQGSSWNGAERRELGGPMKGLYDLYNIWVDSSVNGEKVLYSIDEEA